MKTVYCIGKKAVVAVVDRNGSIKVVSITEHGKVNDLWTKYAVL